jgi:hypothetical protein
MREIFSCSSLCKILNFPINEERPKSEAPVLWSDHPELVLERLRQITGRREWWR